MCAGYHLTLIRNYIKRITPFYKYMNEIITDDYFPGKDCHCEARSSYECGCEDADWTPKEVYDLRSEVIALKAFAESTANLAKSLKEDLDEEKQWHHRTHAELVKAQCNTIDAKQLADRLTALELHSTSELARLEQERDEAREKYATEATEHMLAVNKICNERDEAREEATHWKYEWEIVEARLCGWKHPRDNGIIFEHEVIPVLRKERDEAKNEILGWENKWKCAIDMAARAELERDEARELAQQMSESNQVLQAEVRDYRKKQKAKPFYKY